jgi:high-affinity nickel permease
VFVAALAAGLAFGARHAVESDHVAAGVPVPF